MANPVNLFLYPPGVTSRCGLELAFSANFTFAIFSQNGAARSNGFAFVIAEKAKVGKPGGVGYAGAGAQSIAVVFKTFQNNKQSSEQHVGLHINGVEKSLVAEISPFALTNRAAGYTAWVDYEPGFPGTIQVFLADSTVKPEYPLLKTRLSLCELLQVQVKPFQQAFSFGFVASTTVKPFQRNNILFSSVQTGKWGDGDGHDCAPSPKSPEIKEQDACWAYAVVASVEAAYGIAKKGRAPQLSVEALFAAMGLTGSDKCKAGGSPAQAFEKLVALNASGSSGLTGANNLATRYPVQAFERAQFKGYVGLMLAVRRQPVVVHIEASAATFKAYDGVSHCNSHPVRCLIVPPWHSAA
ncbi:unnamed protein product [Closterium sp. Naga37s-1]|nr:unnamed protein product [Closterium sp. Naga37s-1]